MNIKNLIVASLVALPAMAATWLVQSEPCSGTCYSPVTVSNLNAAIAAAACGDTIEIEAGKAASITGPGQSVNYAKSCPVGQELIITTTMAGWLPDPSDRILPSYRPLLPAITLDGPIGNSAAILISGRSPVASGVKFVGVAFLQDSGYSITSPGTAYSYWIYDGPVPTYPTDTTNLFPDDITFDRTLFYGTYEPNKAFASVVMLNSRSFNFINSYIGGINGYTSTNLGGFGDSSMFRGGDAAQPIKIANNLLCCGWTEGILTGGNPKQSFLSQPQGSNITFTNNISINALRFMPGTNVSITNGGIPAIKNCFEMKEGTDSVFRFNTCVNSWQNAYSQWFGAKMAHYMEDLPGTSFDPNATVTLSTGANGPNSRLTFNTVTANGYLLSRGGIVVGVATVANPLESSYFANGQWEYHKVIKVVSTSPNYVLDMDASYTSTIGTTNVPFMVISNPWTNFARVTVENNVFRDVATALEIDGGDDADYCVQQQTCVNDFTFRNNLQLISNPQANFGAVSIQSSLAKVTWGSNRELIYHNETVIQPSAHPSARALNGILNLDFSSGRIFSGLRVQSNLAGPTIYGGPLGSNLTANTTPDLIWSNNSYLGTPANSSGGAPWNLVCGGGRQCTQNVFDNYNGINLNYRFRNAAANDFSILSAGVSVCGASNTSPIVVTTCSTHSFLAGQPIRIQNVVGNSAANGLFTVCSSGGTLDATHIPLCDQSFNAVQGSGTYQSGGGVTFALWQGAADGTDVGVDFENSPLLRYLSVFPMANAALFQWLMPSGIASQGCQIEVSPDSGLINDDADYTVVNALRPDYFIRADADRANPRALKSPDGRLRWFQAGDPSTQTGDDGQSHDISLTAGTVYYYRLMCGGAMERGSFTTTASDSGQTSITLSVKATAPNATQVRVRYGPIGAALISGNPLPCVSSCSVSVPATSGRSVVYYVDQLDSGGMSCLPASYPRLLRSRSWRRLLT